MLEVLRSGRLSLGPTIDRFEELLAERVGAPYAAAVSSGTAGLHLLCITAGIGPGDEVITSPYSFAASANCFLYEGGVPVFADIDPRTLNLDPAAVEAAVTRADEGDRRGRHLRLSVRARRAARDRRPARPRADRATRARRSAPSTAGAPLGSHGDLVRVRLLSEQADDDRRGRDGRRRTRRRSGACSARSATRAAATPGGWLEHVRLGFNYRLERHRAPRSGSARSSGSTRSSRSAPRRRAATTELLGRIDGRRAAVRRRRRPPPLVVRLRRPLPGQRDARAGRSRAFEREGIGYNRYLPVDPPAAVHASSASASARGSARSPRTSARARWRCRSSRGSRRPRRSASPRCSPPPSEAPIRPSQSTSVCS